MPKHRSWDKISMQAVYFGGILMKHMRKEGKERKNDRKIVKDVFITGDCCGQLTVAWGGLLTVDCILEGCCGWIESTGEPLTLAPHIDWSHSETLTLPAIQLYLSLTIFPKDSRKVLQEQSIEFCLWMNTQDAPRWFNLSLSHPIKLSE